MWGYEHKRQVLFPVDALGYGHHPQIAGLDPQLADIDEPLHQEGECALFSSELNQPPRLELATYLTQASLFWSRYVEIAPFFERLSALLEKYPAKFIAPAHGSVIDDLDIVMPTMREAHKLAFVG